MTSEFYSHGHIYADVSVERFAFHTNVSGPIKRIYGVKKLLDPEVVIWSQKRVDIIHPKEYILFCP